MRLSYKLIKNSDLWKEQPSEINVFTNRASINECTYSSNRWHYEAYLNDSESTENDSVRFCIWLTFHSREDSGIANGLLSKS